MKLSTNQIKKYISLVNKAGFSIHEVGRIRFVKITGESDNRARWLVPALRAALRKDSTLKETVKPRVEHVAETLTVIDEHRLKRENRSLREQLQEALEGQEHDAAYERFIGQISNRPVHAPRWNHIASKSTNRQAMPVAPFSDAHFDEVVDPAQINFVNAYNRKIAKQRLETYFHNLIELAKNYLAGLSYQGIMFPMMGDVFSGNIHEELRQTNEGTMMEAVLYWLGPMEAGITLLADEFGYVEIPVVVGNHPRGTPKPVNKMRVRDNFDWLFARLLERHFASDKRVRFNISEAPDCDFSVFDFRFTMTHGDQFRGGSGIAGLLSPMMIGDARKRKRAVAINKPYDYLLMGHWHQLINARNVIINGSLKGYDEYAFNNNFDFERPRQAFFIVDPRHGITISAPVHVESKDEKTLWPKLRD